VDFGIHTAASSPTSTRGNVEDSSCHGFILRSTLFEVGIHLEKLTSSFALRRGFHGPLPPHICSRRVFSLNRVSLYFSFPSLWFDLIPPSLVHNHSTLPCLKKKSSRPIEVPTGKCPRFPTPAVFLSANPPSAARDPLNR